MSKSSSRSVISRELVDVKGDGDCFFHALYGAARDHGLLDKVASSLQGEKNSCLDKMNNRRTSFHGSVGLSHSNSARRDAFIECFREYLAYAIKHVSFPIITEFYDTTREIFVHGGVNMQQMGAFADWMQDAIKKESIEEFAKIVADHVGTKGVWISQLEYDIIKHVLEKCNVYLLPVVSTLEGAPKEIRENELQLLNMCNVHYKYIRYSSTYPAKEEMTSPTTRSKESRRDRVMYAEKANRARYALSADSAEYATKAVIAGYLLDSNSTKIHTKPNHSESHRSSSSGSHGRGVYATIANYSTKSKYAGTADYATYATEADVFLNNKDHTTN